MQFRFPIVKLLDYQERLAELEASRNPVASLVLALELKFGDAAAPLIAEVRQLTDLALLEAILTRIKTAATLDDLRRV